MLTKRTSQKGAYIFFTGLIVLYILSVLINLSVLPLDGEEPRRAIVSIEMLRSGNYIMPTVFGWEYINKPAVHSWILSLFMFITGSTKEWLIRLPSLVFLLAWAFFHYQFSKKFFPKSIAILSALFLLTDFDLFFYALASGGEIDVFYSFIVYIQVMLLFYFNQQQKWLQLFVWSYVFCAVGFLTKGFPSLIFQELTLVALAVYNRSLKIVFRWQHLVGILVFSILVGGYLYAFSFYGSPQRLVVNLLSESFQKSAVGEHSERLWRKVFVYPFSFLKLLLPWSLLLLLLLKKHSYRLWNEPIVRFSILFILFNIWIYAFTGRPILRYIYAFIPFAFNVVVYIFWRTSEEYPLLIKRIFRYLPVVFLIVLLAVFCLPFFVQVPLLSVIVLLLILIAFIVVYYKVSFNRMWMFCLGLVLLRFIYAVLFIPVKANLIRVNYRQVGESMVKANRGAHITLWSQPQATNVGVDLKYCKWNLESVIAPPYFSNYMIPYYTYYHNREIMEYDTVLQPHKTYFSKRSWLKNQDVRILWSWYDVRQKEELVLYRINSTPVLSSSQ